MEASFILLCLIALSFVLLLTLAVYVIYSGLFTTISPGAGPPPIKNVKFAYKFARGPYKNVHSYFTEITSLAPKLRCVGVYYDDPQQVPSEKLRWAVGTILAEGDEQPDEELLNVIRGKGYRLMNFPRVSNVVKCTFPYNTFLSIIIAIFRVYPLMGEYVRINKLCAHPYLEIYDGYTIHFMAPLARQDEFYVPEASLEEGEELEDDDQGAPLDVLPSTSGAAKAAQEQKEDDDKKKVQAEKDTKDKQSEKIETEKKEKDRETSSKPKVTDSSGKRSPSEETSASAVATKDKSSDTIQDSGISSTASASLASDTSLSPSPKSGSPVHSASDGSATLSESSVLTTTTDASSFESTDIEGTSYTSTKASQGTLSGFSSESDVDVEPFEVVKREDVK